MNSSPPSIAGIARCSKRVMNLAHFMRQSARRYADEIGFVWGEKTWTWTELDRRVDAIGTALSDRGVAKGDRVLVQSRNCNQFFESMFACFRIGAVWVPTNFRQTPDEVAYLAEASGASAMICSSDFPDPHASRATLLPDSASFSRSEHPISAKTATPLPRPTMARRCRPQRSSMMIPAGYSSPQGPRGGPRPPC